MPSYSEIANTLQDSLGLKQAPVALHITEELPPDVPAWSGPMPAGCRFWQEEATRAFATSAAGHGRCAIAQYTHSRERNSASMTDLGDGPRISHRAGYYAPVR
jgi:hypothetical protein